MRSSKLINSTGQLTTARLHDVLAANRATPAEDAPRGYHRASEVTAEDAALRALETAVGQKGLDVRALDLRNATDIADYFVIASGTSQRHVQGIADKVREELRQLGEIPNGSSGYEGGEWVVLDYGDLVVHVFYEPTRQYYAFDELWRGATDLPIEDPELAQAARRLRTGMIR
ncbi:MAG: ribosome silencing factor [Bdellovibrionales bacterium]|nr:ribosome silencing factor [Bdellovibrionales bacterium]